MIGHAVLALSLLAPGVRASVEVDTSEVGTEGPIIRRRILERSDVVLRARDILPAEADDDVRIAVDVDEFDRGGRGFLLTIDVERIGHHEEIECALCTETELVAKYEQELDALAKQLAESGADGEPEPVPPPEPTPDPAPSSGPDVDAGSKGVGRLGKAGIALSVIGGAGVIVGVGLAVNPPKPTADDPTEELFTHTAGYATLGVGAAVLVTGIALLVTDRVRARRNTAVAPSLGPGHAGVAWSGRF